MAVVTGTVAILKAAAAILKVVAKSGIKKAAQSALKTGAKKVVKAKAKSKAKDFLSRKKKRRKGGKEVDEGTREPSSAESKANVQATEKILGGAATGSSALAVIDKSKGKTSYVSINERVDNIVGLTSAIKTVVSAQYQVDKEAAEGRRKQLENEKKRRREALLERGKKVASKVGGAAVGAAKKFGVWGFLSNILLGASVLAILQNLPKIEASFKFLTENLHKIWVALRYGIPLIGKAAKALLGFVKNKAGQLLTSIGKKFGSGFQWVKTKLGKAFKSIGKGITGIGSKIMSRIKDGGKAALQAAWNFLQNLPGAGRVGKFLAGAKNLVVAGATKVRGAVSGAVSGVKGAVSGARTALTQAVGGAPGGVLRRGIGRAGNRLLIKFFGPQAAKAVAGAGQVFKTLGAAAKGIKIPVIGPIIVMVTSLLSGEPLTQGLFKSFGAMLGGSLGGLIGSAGGPLALVGMMLGELIGEWMGDMLYTLFHGGGTEAVKAKFKAQLAGLWEKATDIGKWLAGGFSRFYEGIPKFKVPDFPEDVPSWIPGWVPWKEKLWNAVKLGMKVMLGPLSLLMGKEVPNLLWMLDRKNTGPLLKKSFFPPKGEESEGGDKDVAQVDTKTNGSTAAQTAAIENEASYENGDQVIPVDVSQDQNQQQQAIVAVTKNLNFSSSSSDTVNSLQKQLMMAKLA